MYFAPKVNNFNFHHFLPIFYFSGNWKKGQRDGYGVEESYRKLDCKDAWLTTVLDGCWKEDKFHGWGRMLEFDEIDELLGLASGVEGNLRYEGTWLDNCRDGVGIAIYPNGDKFEGKNHSKGIIQHFERSEIRLHFD